MADVLEAIVVRLQLAADGVQQGMETAKGIISRGVTDITGQLSKIQKAKDALAGEIRLKFENSGIIELQAQLNELAAQKQKLNEDIRFRADSEELADMKSDLSMINGEIEQIEKDIKLHMDIADYMEATGELEKLKEMKTNLEREIKIQAKADTEAAKAEITALEKKELEIAREISIRFETSGINEAQNEMAALDVEMKKAAESQKIMQAGALQAGLAFSAIVIGVKKAMSAYGELSAAQTRLASAMKTTMGATGEQVNHIIKLTQAQEKLGVVSATAQQAGAQELATYMTKKESLQQLIPVLNDVVAQQYQYNATGENVRSVATMLGKVFAGETGSLKRFGYTFTEAQEQVLKFGTEAEKTATLIDVIGASVGGMNEELGKTDFAKITRGNTAVKELGEAFGEALAPSIAAAMEVLGNILGAVTAFVKEHKALTAAIVTFGGILAGVLAVMKLWPVAMGILAVATGTATAAVGGLSAAFAALLANPIVLPLAGLAAATVGIVTAVKSHAKAQEELNEKVKEYNELMGAETDENNIEAQKAEIERLEELKDKYEEYVLAIAALEEARALPSYSYTFYSKEDLDADDASRALREYAKELKALGVDLDDCSNGLDKITAAIAEATSKVDSFKASLDLKTRLEETAALLEETTQACDNSVSSLNSLDSAMQAVMTGKSLGADKLVELIRLYPELARHINETGDATFEYGEVLKRVRAAEKEQAIENIRLTAAELEARLTASQAIIDAKHREIQAIKEASGTDAERAWNHQVAANMQADLQTEWENAENLRNKLEELNAVIRVLQKSKPSEPFPELNKYMKEAGVAAFDSAEALKELSEAAGENLKEWLEFEKKKTQETLTRSRERLNAMQAEMNALSAFGFSGSNYLETAIAGAELQAAKIDKLLEAIGNASSSAPKGGTGAAVYKNEALDSYMKKLDDARALERITEREYAEGLEYCMEALVKTGDERVELEKKVFAQRKAIFAEEYSEFERRERERVDYYGGTLEDMLEAYKAFYDEYAGVMGRDKVKEMAEKLVTLERRAEDERISVKKAALDEELRMGAIGRRQYADGIGELLELYRSYGRDTSALEKEWRQARRDADDAWLNEAKNNAKEYFEAFKDEAGYHDAVKNAEETRKRVIDIYKGYPEKLKPVLDELDAMETSAAERRSGQVVAVEKAKIDGLIGQYDDLISYYRNMNGLVLDDGSTYSFGAYDEAGYVKLELAAVERAIAEYEARLGSLTEAERAEYEARLKQRDSYNKKLRNLAVDALKEEQKAEREDQKARADAIKEANKHITQDIKDAYAERIKAAEEAANAEIAAYENKIKEIDALIKQTEREEQDAGFADKIRRLEEQLKYERDEANKYELQKEIGNLTYEQGKTLTRRGLEDEKARLKDQIAAVKDNLSERKKALEELREAELKAADERLEIETGLLEAQATARKAALNKGETDLNEALANEKADLTAFYNEKEKQEQKSEAGRLSIVKDGMGRVVDFLQSKIREIGNIGYLTGQAWADNFIREVERAKAEAGMPGGPEAYGGYDGYGAAAASPAACICYNITQPQKRWIGKPKPAKSGDKISPKC